VTKLEAFKKVCKDWMVISDDTYIDVLFGVIAANRLDSKPVWLYLIGPPGSGKTEIVQSWRNVAEVYATEGLTAHTIISGKILEDDEPDPSLLPKLNGKVLVIKDFTTILSMRNEDVHAIWGQLRNAYDGTARINVGTGKDTLYVSKFGLIACVTDILDAHTGLVSSLGERFLTYRMPRVDENERWQRAEKAAACESTLAMEATLAAAAEAVFAAAAGPATLPVDLRHRLVGAAAFLARARTWVPRNRNHEVIGLPDPEVPTRIAKQLVALAKGVAMMREKPQVEQAEVDLMERIVVDGVPVFRARILEFMANSGAAGVTVGETTAKLGLSDSPVRLALEDFVILGLVSARTEALPHGNLRTTQKRWTLDPNYRNLWRQQQMQRAAQDEAVREGAEEEAAQEAWAEIVTARAAEV